MKERPFDNFVYSVSDGEWKLMYRPASPKRTEIFHLKSDPGELRNLFKYQPKQLKQLKHELASCAPWIDEKPAFEADDPALQFTRALLALGYAGEETQDLATPRWAWSCILDGSQTLERGACPQCGELRLLIAAGGSPLPAWDGQ